MRKLDIPVGPIAELYAIGVPAGRIADELHTTLARVKGIVRRECLERDPSRYPEGVVHLAQPGEQFREAAPGYWVSDHGRVLSMRDKPGSVLKPEIDVDGYHRVSLWIDGRQVHRAVHRLVALAFIGEPLKDEAVAHNNGIRDDNRVQNLRWATQADNVADKVAHGTEQIGSRHGMAITDEASIAKVKAALRAGKTIQEAADAGGTTFNVAADVSRNRTWRHVR